MKPAHLIATYFWKQQDDIPAGMGYELFGPVHLLCVAVTVLAVIALILSARKAKEKSQRRFLKALPVFMVILEIFKDCFLISVHRFGVWYLPLHFCSIGIFIFLLREYLPVDKLKEILGEIAFMLILPGSVAALFFADWTIYYPVWNFMNIYSYIWHGLLVLYPVMIYIRREIRPSIKHIHWNLIFLCLAVPPIYVFDKHFDVNYFFVNRPVHDSPLEWIASFMGNPGYLVGYAVLALILILLLYFVVWIMDLITGRRDTRA